MKNFFRYLKNAVLGTMIASKAGASVVAVMPQPQVKDDNWDNLRRHLEASSASNATFDFHLPDPATAPEALPHVFNAIRSSYLTTEKSIWLDLDAYWTKHPKVKTSPIVFQEFLAARSSVQMHLQGTREEILQNWLYNAHHKPGHYDNGGGNDGDGDGNTGNGNGKK